MRQRLRSILFVFIGLTQWQAPSAWANTVPLFHDFLGGVCVQEADLEDAYAVGFKGARPPPVCLVDPCAGRLERGDYERQILGRSATNTEWTDYEAQWDRVCVGMDGSDSLTQLVPVGYDLSEFSPITSYWLPDPPIYWSPNPNPDTGDPLGAQLFHRPDDRGMPPPRLTVPNVRGGGGDDSRFPPIPRDPTERGNAGRRGFAPISAPTGWLGLISGLALLGFALRRGVPNDMKDV
ncbi:MAG: hypothetical protein AAGF71_10860 [Pseudomonadota bacterium]